METAKTHQLEDLGRDTINFVSHLPRQAIKIANYMLGRGLIAVALFGAGLAHLEFGPAAFLALPLITGFQAFMDYRKEQNARYDLLNNYREEVAVKLGIDPKGVTVKDVEMLVNGNVEMGIDPNPILAEAWQRTGKSLRMRLVTTAIAGFAALGLVLGTPFAQDVQSIVHTVTSDNPFGLAFTYTGLTLTGGLVLQTINRVLDAVGAMVLGINKSTVQDHIRMLDKQLQRGQMLTREQVMSVFVAADAGLAERIEYYYGKPYDRLPPTYQRHAALHLGAECGVEEMTYDLNFGYVKTQELAFAAVGQSSGVQPMRHPEHRHEETEKTQEHSPAVAAQQSAQPAVEAPC